MGESNYVEVLYPNVLINGLKDKAIQKKAMKVET